MGREMRRGRRGGSRMEGKSRVAVGVVVFVLSVPPITQHNSPPGIVWCGVVWCGVVWCGGVWCGVVWCGVVWWGVV